MSRAPRSVYSTAIALLIGVALLWGLALQAMTTFKLLDWPTEDVEHQQIEEMSRITAQRLEAVKELVAGRRSLSQTVATFRQLTDRSCCDTMHNLRNLYPEYSDEELHYVHVLMFVEAHRRPWCIAEEKVNSLHDEFELYRKSGRGSPRQE